MRLLVAVVLLHVLAFVTDIPELICYVGSPFRRPTICFLDISFLAQCNTDSCPVSHARKNIIRAQTRTASIGWNSLSALYPCNVDLQDTQCIYSTHIHIESSQHELIYPSSEHSLRQDGGAEANRTSDELARNALAFYDREVHSLVKSIQTVRIL